MDEETWYTKDNTPDGTPQKVIDDLNSELRVFRLQWGAFNHHNMNSPTGTNILPISLAGFMYDMVHASYHQQQVLHEPCGEEDSQVFAGYATFGALMFRFGQWCERQGIYDSNLTEIVDPENPSMDIDMLLKQFLEGGDA